MNATEVRISNCSTVDELEDVRKDVSNRDLPPQKKERYLKKIAALYPRLIGLSKNDRRGNLHTDLSTVLSMRDVTQKSRWRKITKYDGDGNHLLVGYERRSRLSRKAGETRWLKKPKLLKAASPTAPPLEVTP